MRAAGLLGFAVLALLGLAGCTPPPPNNITLTVIDDGSVGYTAAYQVGTGSWTAFTPNSTNTYTFPLNGNTKYGVAVLCRGNPPTVPTVHVIQATNAELANPKVTCSSPSQRTVNYTLNVDVTNVPGIAINDRVMVNRRSLSSAEVGLVTVSGGNYTASVNLTAQPGTQDLLVVVDSSSSLLPKAAKVLRNVNITSGGSSSHTLTAADVVAPANVSVTIPSGFSGEAEVFYLSTDNKEWGIVGNARGTAGLNFPYRPVAGFGSGDRYVLVARASSSDNNVLLSFKGATGGNLTLTLPSPWGQQSLTVTDQAHPNVSGLNYTDPNLKAYQIGLDAASLTFLVTLSKGWLGNATTYTVPNLSSQFGYTPFASDRTVGISIIAILSPLSSADVLNLDINNPDPAPLGANTDISLVWARGRYTVGGGTNTQLP